jgi:hypothetical protein
MAAIKLTIWNIEHFGTLLPDTRESKKPKLNGIVDEITEIDPDILCIVEGPPDLPALRDWVASPEGLGGRYHVATIPGTDEILDHNPADPRAALQDLYSMQGTATTGKQ